MQLRHLQARLRCLRISASARSIQTRARGPQDPDSLLIIPGIGRAAQEKLANRDVNGVKKLCQLFVDKHARDKEALVSFLAEAGIGVRWRDMIATWVGKHSDLLYCPARRPITFCVEGNVGAGKSTYLSMINDIGKCNEIQVVQEPVEQWRNVNGENLLERFYRDPKRYAFTFQQYVLLTRINREEATRPQPHSAGLRLIERSVFCDRMVFVKAVHALKQLSDLELEVYDSWFNPWLQRVPELTPDAFVYLRTTPDTCVRRMQRRNRSEETGIGRSYLADLNSYHDSWLVEGGSPLADGVQTGSGDARSSGQSMLLGNGHHTHNVLTPASKGYDTCYNGEHVKLSCVDQPNESKTPGSTHQQLPMIPPLSPRLQGKVVLLDNQKLRHHSYSVASRLHHVPALHVPCDQDVDIHDLDQMSERAQTMCDFREWVHEYQELNKELLDSWRSQLQRSLLLPPSKEGTSLGNQRMSVAQGGL